MVDAFPGRPAGLSGNERTLFVRQQSAPQDLWRQNAPAVGATAATSSGSGTSAAKLRREQQQQSATSLQQQQQQHQSATSLGGAGYANGPTSWPTNNGKWIHRSSPAPYQLDVNEKQRHLPKVLAHRVGMWRPSRAIGKGPGALAASATAPDLCPLKQRFRVKNAEDELAERLKALEGIFGAQQDSAPSSQYMSVRIEELAKPRLVVQPPPEPEPKPLEALRKKKHRRPKDSSSSPHQTAGDPLLDDLDRLLNKFEDKPDKPKTPQKRQKSLDKVAEHSPSRSEKAAVKPPSPRLADGSKSSGSPSEYIWHGDVAVGRSKSSLSETSSAQKGELAEQPEPALQNKAAVQPAVKQSKSRSSNGSKASLGSKESLASPSAASLAKPSTAASQETVEDSPMKPSGNADSAKLDKSMSSEADLGKLDKPEEQPTAARPASSASKSSREVTVKPDDSTPAVAPAASMTEAKDGPGLAVSNAPEPSKAGAATEPPAAVDVEKAVASVAALRAEEDVAEEPWEKNGNMLFEGAESPAEAAEAVAVEEGEEPAVVAAGNLTGTAELPWSPTTSRTKSRGDQSETFTDDFEDLSRQPTLDVVGGSRPASPDLEASEDPFEGTAQTPVAQGAETPLGLPSKTKSSYEESDVFEESEDVKAERLATPKKSPTYGEDEFEKDEDKGASGAPATAVSPIKEEPVGISGTSSGAVLTGAMNDEDDEAEDFEDEFDDDESSVLAKSLKSSTSKVTITTSLPDIKDKSEDGTADVRDDKGDDREGKGSASDNVAEQANAPPTDPAPQEEVAVRSESPQLADGSKPTGDATEYVWHGDVAVGRTSPKAKDTDDDQDESYASEFDKEPSRKSSRSTHNTNNKE